MNKVLCIIPARDEEEGISRALNGLIVGSGLNKSQFIVVNNASKDQTPTIVREMGLLLLDCPEIGYGNACLVALDWINKSKLDPEYILFCDADGSDDPSDIQKLIRVIKETKADLVIGSRTIGNVERGALSPIQIFGNALTCFLILLFFRRKFTDMGPLRIVKYASFLKLQMQDPTWGWNIEMHVKALQLGLDIREISVNYRKRFAGVSKISGTFSMSLRVGIKILYTFFRLLIFRVH
ncbi:glycosyltransferase family 2 protein [Leptospira meyeri]|uniref:glycosyltransferase family 2 protein n=1 Tax=Leptospira meyeri TaxID=29508 RepID=UPI000C2A8675|nr:glycosyltransferase family 2 protein [Leptospira meyeri]PKA24194.1 glycosyl transferase [Leptospira sp. mixed culture ATI2-C-A1]PJZ79670.1 glycosyl transferase [Leptospira meyeri]PJZ95926.1 glycosyl transferase [Leptospira meyeri]PKA12068.1 glycosyl transferase [Leptospira meyeri]TGM25462.1 glycosyltransferase family 2 protein [Leptospira meyeri]